MKSKTLCFLLITSLFTQSFCRINSFPLYEGNECSSLTYENFGVPKEKYLDIFSDGKVSDNEREYLYSNYYTESPKIFKSHATWYGGEQESIGELLQYSLWIKQQMDRGWVLIGSGKYGYHPELKEELDTFIKNNYWYKDSKDILLSKQKSPLYFYFADGGNKRVNRDFQNQPIPVKYDSLNDRQKRVLDITVTQAYKMKKSFFVSISEQSNLTEQEALNSGKYLAVVSSKTINDFGRRFMIYKCVSGKLDFIGIVLVGGEAKRDDWTGMGSPTNIGFSYNHAPLSIRENNEIHWGFDFPTELYNYFGGTTGATGEIIAIDPDK